MEPVRHFCSVPGCKRVARSNEKGHCELHFAQYKNNGKVTNLPRRQEMCKADGCKFWAESLGLCYAHHQQRYYQKRHIPNVKYLVDRAVKRVRHVLEEIVEEKRCSACMQVKPLSEFGRWTGKRQGYRTQCKECQHDNDIVKALFIYDSQCQDPECNCTDVTVLQWHHREGRQKECNATMMKRIVVAGQPLPDVMLLCANHHIHWDLKDGTGSRASTAARIQSKVALVQASQEYVE